MAKGRKRDNPRDQRAKGYPGRRKSKTEKAIDAMERAAARDAKLFADASAGGNLASLPIFLEDARLASAQTIWKEYAPRLDKLHLLGTLDRYTFAMFCIYSAEFVLANRDILDKGYSILVTTVAGAKSGKSRGTQMPRLNPSVDRRDYAGKMMLHLAEKFGFTPLDRNKLIREHAMRNDEETLFGRVRAPPDVPTEQPTSSGDPVELVGALGSFDSTPPKPRMN